MLDQSPENSQSADQNNLTRDSSHDLSEAQGPSHNPGKLSFGEQTFLQQYGSRFERLTLTMSFNIHTDVTSPLDGGSRILYLDALKREMGAVKARCNELLEADGLKDRLQINYLAALKAATCICSPADADELMARLKPEPFFHMIADMSDTFVTLPDAEVIYRTFWENGSPTADFYQPSNDSVARYVMKFHSDEPVSDFILAEIDACLRNANLVGLVGVSIASEKRENDNRLVILTCTKSDLQFFTALPNLAKISAARGDVVSSEERISIEHD